MTQVNDLLKPRRKVISPYPYSTNTVGEVITFHSGEGRISINGVSIWPIDKERLKVEWYDQFPLIFRPLEWHEHREPGEMPEYVKDDGEVFKVIEWHTDLASKVTVFVDPKIHKGFVPEATQCPIYGNILPATEQEYLSYIQSKTK